MATCRLVIAALLLLIGSICTFGQENRAHGDVSEASRNIHRREQWFAQGRMSGLEPVAIARHHALRQKMAMRAFRRGQSPKPESLQNALAGEWVQLGPAPLISDASGVGLQDYNFVAGRATAVVIDPADSSGNTVYIGGAYGGVWKSSNAGPLSSNPGSVAWVPLTDNEATLAVGSIAIQPQLSSPDPAKSVILVGTGETNGSTDSYYGLGILRSADAGSTWKLISNDGSPTPRSFAGLGFSKIAFSTSNPSLVVAAAGATALGITEGKENPVSVNRGIYYSADSGVSWNYSTIKDGNALTDPASVSSVVYNAAANHFFAAVSQHGIYSSSDGINWSRLANQPGSLTTASCPAHIVFPSACPIFRGEFAVVPNRLGPKGKGELYLWYVDANDSDGGIWTSTDAGTTWSQINEGGITSCGDLLGGCGTSQGFYNLSLAAVPDGSATDLYAGAVNLYKCTISVISPNCNGAGAGTFINLTHVFGCSSIAKVHPAQHSMAFMLVNNNNQDLMYFANDGGIYRSLDGYTGLVSGDCGGSNLFDSLNQTLGSMTQLVSFSESSRATPSPDILLAGAQGNGSPATVSVQSTTTWQNVDAGDGGYTSISPDNDHVWFVSNPPDSVSGVNIFTCASGISCHTLDFLNNEIVSGTTVGGDAGAFNTAFMLDPQDSLEMLVGTCRVWRGPSAGGSFTDLSFNFETGGTGICSGAETNLVRALAAGGAKDANGFSNVIYAGTEGTGPLSTGLPTGGHVWVSSNVASGPTTWIDQTGPINPGNLPISSIAVDSSDASGLTAYAAVMGFHVSHVWKTIDAGASWTDFTANLPDAPANALLIDPGLTPDAGALYVGTDVGVFASSTGTANWIEVGPSPDSDKPGFLPNVAVTALHIFDPGGARRLRVSTYGRGMWELAGFNLSRPMPADVTVGTPGTSSPVTLQLTATAFSGTVNLFCTVPAWVRCAFENGASTLSVGLSPANPFTVVITLSTTANAPSGPFPVAVHAAASGSSTETQNLSVTVIGGFGFSIANGSGSQTIIAGQAATYNLSVAPSSGTFPNPVTLSCSGLPIQTTCSFSPGTVPASSGTTKVVLRVATQGGTPPGTYSTVTVTGTSGFVNASAELTLVVQSAFSFSLSNSGPSAIIAGSSAKYDITVTPSGGPFPSPVALTFLGCPLYTNCKFDTATIAAGSGTTDVSLTVATTGYPNGTPPGPYSITVIGTSGSETANTIVAFTVQAAPFSFSMSNSGPATIEVGSSGKYDITITPSGSAFPNPAVLSFTGCPSAASCSLSSTLVPSGSGTTDVLLTVATTSGTPGGSYKITVTGTSGSQTANTVISFIVHSNTFSFSMSNSGPATVAAGSSGKYDIRVTPSAGTFPNAVALTVTGCTAPMVCSFDTPTIPAGSGATDVFLTVATAAGSPVGLYAIAVTGTSGSLIASTNISLSVIAFNFTMSSSGPATIAVGSSAKYDVTITPSAGTFPNPVALTFTGCPAVSTCSLNTAQVTAGSGTTDVFLTVATTSLALHSEKKGLRILVYGLWMPLPGMLIVFGGIRSAGFRWTLRALFMMVMLALCSGCGGLQGGSAAPAPNPGTPPGVYTITVIGTSGSLTANTTISLTVH